jgi:hypothetical protein
MSGCSASNRSAREVNAVFSDAAAEMVTVVLIAGSESLAVEHADTVTTENADTMASGKNVRLLNNVDHDVRSFYGGGRRNPHFKFQFICGFP